MIPLSYGTFSGPSSSNGPVWTQLSADSSYESSLRPEESCYLLDTHLPTKLQPLMLPYPVALSTCWTVNLQSVLRATVAQALLLLPQPVKDTGKVQCPHQMTPPLSIMN